MEDNEGLSLLQPSGLPGGAGGGCGFVLGARALSDESEQWLGRQASVLGAGHKTCVFCFSQPRVPCPLGRATVRRGELLVWFGEVTEASGPGQEAASAYVGRPPRRWLREVSDHLLSVPEVDPARSTDSSPVALEGTSHRGSKHLSCPGTPQVRWPAATPSAWYAGGTPRACD